jgi:hypothetical protein
MAVVETVKDVLRFVLSLESFQNVLEFVNLTSIRPGYFAVI